MQNNVNVELARTLREIATRVAEVVNRPLSELPRLLNCDLNWPSRTIARTFDDGTVILKTPRGKRLHTTASRRERVDRWIAGTEFEHHWQRIGAQADQAIAALRCWCEKAAATVQRIAAEAEDTSTLTVCDYLDDDLRGQYDDIDHELTNLVLDLRELAAVMAPELRDEVVGQTAKPPAMIEGKSEDMRNARWFARATKDGVYAGLLRQAHKTNRILGKKISGRWQYPLIDVCKEWPQYKKSIEKAHESEEKHMKA